MARLHLLVAVTAASPQIAESVAFHQHGLLSYSRLQRVSTILSSSLLHNSCRRCISSDHPNRPRSTAFPQKTPSYYDDLQVSTDATKDEIRRSFLRLAKIHHPDMVNRETDNNSNNDSNSNNTEMAEFQRIQTAYDVLTDPDKRREYDWRLRGIWRHNPSWDEHRPERSHVSADLWNKTGDRQKDHNRKTQYTEQDLAELKAAEREADLRYQQLMIKRYREIGRQKEAQRQETYKTALSDYERKLLRRDDDFEAPGNAGFLHKLVKSLRLYLASFRRSRVVSF